MSDCYARGIGLNIPIRVQTLNEKSDLENHNLYSRQTVYRGFSDGHS